MLGPLWVTYCVLSLSLTVSDSNFPVCVGPVIETCAQVQGDGTHEGRGRGSGC